MTGVSRRGGDYRRLVELSESLLSGFEDAGYERIDPPMLHDAAHVGLGGQTLLDLTYLMGNGLALRSDFTVPVYLLHAERGRDAGTPRYCYSGPVFRRAGPGDDRPTEYLQTGIEYFGSLRREAADVRIFANILGAVRKAGLRNMDIATGDVSLFHALLQSLDLSDRVRARLRGLFWRPERLKEQITRMTQPIESAEGFAGTDVDTLARTLRETRVVQGKRSARDVAAQLIARQSDTIPAETAQILQNYLSIRTTIGDAADRVRAALGDRVSSALEAFEDRAQQMRHRLGPEVLGTPFHADFGRRHEYYDGFVFEMTVGGETVAAGGRYDRLAHQVGAADWPAIGGMIRPQVLLRALEGDA